MTDKKKFFFVIIAHGLLADELLKTLRYIVGPCENFVSIGIDHEIDVDDARRKIEDTLSSIPSDKSIIIFTDLLGGTPSKLALPIIEKKSIELIGGVNIPVLLKATMLDEDDMTPNSFAKKLCDYGKENIFLASNILSKPKSAI